MRIIVSPLAEVAALHAAHSPSHILSLMSPEIAVPRYGTMTPERHLILRFHDILAPQPGLIAVDSGLMRALLEFGEGWDCAAPLLVHCWAGISRSTAAAFVLACQHGCDEFATALALRRAAPSATPNILMVRLADDLLGRNGRMVEAIAVIGRGTDAAIGSPFELALNEILP